MRALQHPQLVQVWAFTGEQMIHRKT